VLRRHRHVVDDVVVEGDDADAVALLVGEVGQAGRQVAAAPYMDLRYETMNFGVLAEYPRGGVSSRSQSRSVSCFLRAEGAFI
jgi:hypothetical protein